MTEAAVAEPLAPEVEADPIEVVGILPEKVNRVWAHIVPLVRRAIEKDPWINPGAILELARDGQVQLFAALDRQKMTFEAILVTEIALYPCRKVAILRYIGGAEPKRWIEWLPALEVWARSIGCQEIATHKKLGKDWRRHSTLYAKVLSEEEPDGR